MTQKAQAAQATTTGGRNRSPNYPAISLGEAIQRIQAIYRQQQQHPTNREVFAKLLGYNSLNGASAVLISALSKYGLLEGHGERLRVSALGQDLSLHRPDDPEYAAAVEQAAFTPTLFRDLHERYPNGLPSDHSVRVDLVKGRFNPKTVDGVIRVYRDTLELVNTINADSTTVPSDDGAMETPMQALPVTGPRQDTTGSAPVIGGVPTATPNDPRMRAVQLPYSNTEWGTLYAAFPLSEENWDLMLTLLNAMKPALVARPEKQDRQADSAEQSGPILQ